MNSDSIDPGELIYASEKSYMATRCLVGKADIRKRVQNALMELLVLKMGHNLDKELAKRLRDMFSALDKGISEPKSGKMAVNVGLMSDDEVEKLATDILDFFIDVCRKKLKNHLD